MRLSSVSGVVRTSEAADGGKGSIRGGGGGGGGVDVAPVVVPSSAVVWVWPTLLGAGAGVANIPGGDTGAG